MNLPDVVLVGWSGLAAIWWLLAIALVAGTRRRSKSRSGGPLIPLTLFKPLPAVTDELSRKALAAAVASFLAQMDDTCELLVGVPQTAATAWQPIIAEWAQDFPAARVRIFPRPAPRQRANPKIAWLEILAPEATGECWLWSDADVVAAPGMLAELRREFAGAQAGAVTAAYCVRTAPRAAGMVDALFVNMEFLPGALLLARLGPVKFSFGAAVIFRAEEFRRRVSWTELGTRLADDYALGQQLAPVVISPTLAETCALESRFGPALRHLHRWQKTIRWCRPGSFAALLVILPLLGWLGRCGLAPRDRAAWAGLGLQYLLEVVAAGSLMALLRFRRPRGGFGILLAWPFLRIAGWLAAWLPLPVFWGDVPRPWRGPIQTE